MHVCVCVGARHSLVLQPLPASHINLGYASIFRLRGVAYIASYAESEVVVGQEDEKFEEENSSWGKGGGRVCKGC